VLPVLKEITWETKQTKMLSHQHLPSHNLYARNTGQLSVFGGVVLFFVVLGFELSAYTSHSISPIL
jgi:hypothetical protein